MTRFALIDRVDDYREATVHVVFERMDQMKPQAYDVYSFVPRWSGVWWVR